MSRILVADLPPMTQADLLRFEKEGGVWGQQRAVRKQQVAFAWKATAFSMLAGCGYVKLTRKNTLYVVLGTSPVFGMFGFAVGHAIATCMYPNVANNKETTLMRRTWWAKECSKSWSMDQVERGFWKAQYPHATVLSEGKS